MEQPNNSSFAGSRQEEFIISRVFDAPRSLVFKAWAEPERLMQWWGPKGFTMQTAKVELRPGGIFHYCLKSPAGHEMWGKFVYRDIIEPEKLEYVVSFSDAEGRNTRHPLSQTWPLEVLTTVLFEEQEGKTLLTIKASAINATEEERATYSGGIESIQQGTSGMFDQLDEYLATNKDSL